MPLSWTEIKDRAIRFSKEWTGVSRERAEAQTFWNEFFQVFGIKRRTVAAFEAPVKKLSGDWGFIDCFWKGKLLVEHKSYGKDLGKAESQGNDYIQALAAEGRADECPRYLLVSDFARFALHDLDDGTHVEFPLAQLWRHIHAFAFIAGYQTHDLTPDDPLNLRAAQIMGDLHDALEHDGYAGHDLERFLVRVLFCLFAEDNGIFEPQAFTAYIEDYTAPDGHDLGIQLHWIFAVLNMPPEQRQGNLPAALSDLPYVNGGLFAETLNIPFCTAPMRVALLRAAAFNWSRISPAVFGSLFQAVMEPGERRQIGGHYTSERDIMKVVRSLFLDDLRAEFAAVDADRSTRRNSRLDDFLAKLAGLRFLDPACGCGNFLVITYRELRLLEMDVLVALYSGPKGIHPTLEVDRLFSEVDVDQFYGIEISEWPALIAEVAMWLMDHQMNQRLSEVFGQYYVRLPLRKSATVVVGNALRLDWRAILPPDQCSYILGNPPFVGGKYQTGEQKEDMQIAAPGVANLGLLDYVTGWYFKAAQYIAGTEVRVAFVSTNSISQGEQVAPLWEPLIKRFGMRLKFAHRTFPWESEARGKAHVHVVIIGFSCQDVSPKHIFEYEAGGKEPTVHVAEHICPYLVDAPDVFITSRRTPICDVPTTGVGNQPIDGGNYLFTAEEKERFLAVEPGAAPYFRLWLGSQELINGNPRSCLWLGDCPPQELRKMPEAIKRVEAVKQFRLASKRPVTRKLADMPTRFAFENMPSGIYLAIPEVSSIRRSYIPIGFLTPDIFSSNLLRVMPDATHWHFGVLESAMHMAWVRQVCGRLKSDYRYSTNLVYNNFPWPSSPTASQVGAVEDCAREVLAVRERYPEATLADLYDPLTMPPDLVKAHAALDRAVEKCYRGKPFANDRERVEHLFALYEELTAGE